MKKIMKLSLFKMNFEEITNIFNPYLSSKMIGFAVRPTTIWTLRSDSTLYVFKRSNPKVFSKFPFDGLDAVLAKISVDKLGEKCVIFWDRLPVLYFSLATGQFTVIPNIKPSFYPSAACWMTDSDGSSKILFGSITGEIMSIASDEDHSIEYLHVMPRGQTIRELHSHVINNIKMIFVNVDDQIITFYGSGNLKQIFEKGPSNKVIVLLTSDIQTGVEMESKILLDTYEGKLRLSTFHTLGVISYYAHIDGERLANYEQKISEIDISNVATFETCPWGFLIGLEKNILFLYNLKPKASLPIQNVKQIHCDYNGLVLFTENEIITITMKSFLHYLVHDAIRHKLFDYALTLAGNDSIKYYVLRKQVEKMNYDKIGSYIVTLKWKLNEIVQAIGMDTIPTLMYLIEVINLMPKTRTKQRLSLIFWTFQLFCKFYPNFDKQFLKFLHDYATDLPKSETYEILKEINCKEGIIEFAKALDDKQKIVNLLISNIEPTEILEYLSSIKDSHLISYSLLRMITSNSDKVKEFLVANALKILTIDQLPLLSLIPTVASTVLTDFSSDNLVKNIYMISLCMNHQDERIIQILKRSKPDYALLYRFTKTFECNQAESNILIRLNKPKQAVRVAMKFGTKFVNNFLAGIKDTAAQKAAWSEFVHNISGDERNKAINRLIATNLFTFEELIDVIGDDTYLYEYADEMLSAVKLMEKESETVYFTTNFHNVRAPDFPLSYIDTCHYCPLPLLGTKFTAFPCGHKMHKECLRKAIDEIRSLHPDEHIDDLESCPVCGMFSVETVSQPFTQY